MLRTNTFAPEVRQGGHHAWQFRSLRTSDDDDAVSYRTKQRLTKLQYAVLERKPVNMLGEFYRVFVFDQAFKTLKDVSFF